MLISCNNELPNNVTNYTTNESYFKINIEPIPITENDPHEGIKNV